MPHLFSNPSNCTHPLIFFQLLKHLQFVLALALLLDLVVWYNGPDKGESEEEGEEEGRGST